MKINRNLWALGGVAVLAFVAGRANLLSDIPPAAFAVTGSDAQEEMEMDAETLAYMAAGTPGEHHEYLEPLIGERLFALAAVAIMGLVILAAPAMIGSSARRAARQCLIRQPSLPAQQEALRAY